MSTGDHPAIVPLLWVDAFADGPFRGNPAGVCFLDGPVDEVWMQRLASELGLSETAYVWPDGDALSLRWFTPTSEVSLCGHATLAAAHALRETGHWRRWPEPAVGDELVFRTRSGPVSARFDGTLVEIDLPADEPVECPVPSVVAPWRPVAVARGSLPTAEGRSDLLVEVASAEVVRAVSPDPGALAGLPYRTVVVTAPGDEPDVDYVLRVFAPAVGVDEDPVTGSAQCLLGPYWSARQERTVLEAVQLSARGGRLRVTVAGERVRVAGYAVTVLAGHLAPAGAPPGPSRVPEAAGPSPVRTIGLPEP